MISNKYSKILKPITIMIVIFCIFNIAGIVLAVVNTPETVPASKLTPTTKKTSAGKEMGRQLTAVNKTAGYDAPTDPRIVAANTIKTVLNFLGIIFLCFIVYAGFLWMTAGGSEEGIEKSKKILYRSVIGLIIIIAAYSITWAAFKIALNYSDKDTSGVYIMPPS